MLGLMIIQKASCQQDAIRFYHSDAYAGLADLGTLACCGFGFFTPLGLVALAGVDALVAAPAFICARFLALKSRTILLT
jgi:hypothetical protein